MIALTLLIYRSQENVACKSGELRKLQRSLIYRYIQMHTITLHVPPKGICICTILVPMYIKRITHCCCASFPTLSDRGMHIANSISGSWNHALKPFLILHNATFGNPVPFTGFTDTPVKHEYITPLTLYELFTCNICVNRGKHNSIFFTQP